MSSTNTTPPTEPYVPAPGRDSIIAQTYSLAKPPGNTPKTTEPTTTTPTGTTRLLPEIEPGRHRCPQCSQLCRNLEPKRAPQKTGRKREHWPYIRKVLQQYATPEHPYTIQRLTNHINERYEKDYMYSAISRSVRREVREGRPIKSAGSGKYYWAGDPTE